MTPTDEVELTGVDREGIWKDESLFIICDLLMRDGSIWGVGPASTDRMTVKISSSDFAYTLITPPSKEMDCMTQGFPTSGLEGEYSRVLFDGCFSSTLSS